MRTWGLRLRAAMLASAVGWWVSGAMAAPVADALNRGALKVNNVRGSVLLCAAQAGARWVAVGERGVVALSDDGGHTWHQAASVPVSVTLTAVRFVNERSGWATGHAGVVLHTDDAGETWNRQLDGVMLAQIALRDAQAMAEQQRPGNAEAAQALRDAQVLTNDGPDKPLLDLDFSDDQHGIVVGAYNLIFATSDGGKTWQSWMDRTGNTKALHLYALGRHGDDVYVAGEQGLLLHSSDAGRSFTRVALPYQGSWFALAVQPDRAVIVAGLRGNAYRFGANGDAPVRLSGSGPASFASAVKFGADKTLLATQTGQLFSVNPSETTLHPLHTDPLPPLAGALPLGDDAVLALSVQGPVLVPQPGSVK